MSKTIDGIEWDPQLFDLASCILALFASQRQNHGDELFVGSSDLRIIKNGGLN